MLVTARENDCQYIWYAHAAAGRRAGLSDDLVNNLRDKRPLTGISAQESAVVEFGQEYFRTRRVSRRLLTSPCRNSGSVAWLN